MIYDYAHQMMVICMPVDGKLMVVAESYFFYDYSPKVRLFVYGDRIGDAGFE
jgi:hypothetical protein